MRDFLHMESLQIQEDLYTQIYMARKALKPSDIQQFSIFVKQVSGCRPYIY